MPFGCDAACHTFHCLASVHLQAILSCKTCSLRSAKAPLSSHILHSTACSVKARLRVATGCGLNLLLPTGSTVSPCVVRIFLQHKLRQIIYFICCKKNLLHRSQTLFEIKSSFASTSGSTRKAARKHNVRNENCSRSPTLGSRLFYLRGLFADALKNRKSTD